MNPERHTGGSTPVLSTSSPTEPVARVVSETSHSPLFASILAILGFGAMFAAAVVDLPELLVLGSVAVISAGLWAGFVGDRHTPHPVVVPVSSGPHTAKESAKP